MIQAVKIYTFRVLSVRVLSDIKNFLKAKMLLGLTIL